MGPQHRLLGALFGAGWATYTHQSLPVVALTAAVATVTAAGPLSPDMDQADWWHAIPGRGGALAHRGLTHWWGLPVAGWLLLPHVPLLYAATATALLLGWVSHLFGDFLFGRIPLTPWGTGRVGLGLHTGSFTEKRAVRALLSLGLLYLFVVQPLHLIGALA